MSAEEENLQKHEEEPEEEKLEKVEKPLIEVKAPLEEPPFDAFIKAYMEARGIKGPKKEAAIALSRLFREAGIDPEKELAEVAKRFYRKMSIAKELKRLGGERIQEIAEAIAARAADEASEGFSMTTQPYNDDEYKEFLQVFRKHVLPLAMAIRSLDYFFNRPGNGQSSNVTSSENLIASLIKSGVEPERVNEWLSKLDKNALSVLLSLSSGNPASTIIPYLIANKGEEKGNPTLKETIEAVKDIYDITDKMSDKSKGKEGEGITTQILSIMKDMYEKLISDKLDKIAEKIADKTESKKSFLEIMLEDPDKFSKLKELFGSSINPQVQIELKKLDLEIKKMELDLKRQLLEMKRKDRESRRKAALLVSSLKKIGEAIAEGIEESKRELRFGKLEYVGTNEVEISCPKDGTILKGMPGQNVMCDKCKTVYLIKQFE
ncbi:MAG: hypothetical protein QW253_00175 [Metallosphaera sp.]